ncbi:hypothetical protein ACFLXC_06670 [Chloroflexota bacterium]
MVSRKGCFFIKQEFIHLFDEALEEFLDSSLPVIDAHKIKPTNLSQDVISKANKNAEAYTFLYFVENSARNLINTRMKKIWGEDWWQKIDYKNGELLKIKENAENLKNKESRNKLIQQEKDNLFYCDIGNFIDFIRISFSMAGTRDQAQNNAQVLSCLQEIDGIRKQVAHTRPICEDIFDLLKNAYLRWCKLTKEIK